MKDSYKKVPKSDLVDVTSRSVDRKDDRPAQAAEVRKMPKGKK